MGVIEDVIRALERIPAWRRLQELPDHVARLEQRVAELEAQLKPGAGKCPKCGAMEFMVQASGPAPAPWGALGVLEDKMRCGNCGHSEARQRDSFQ